jgi:glycosyltransferase involved in cell wall biosynthesis
MVNDGVNIVIPTYNRVDSLRKTLLLLCKALKGLDNIDIIVIDNSSTDGTQKLLLSMKGIFDKSGVVFNYKINKRNIGLDGSILYAAKNILSSERFTWFLSDDDYLLAEGVRSFVGILLTSNKVMEIANFTNPMLGDIKIKPFIRASFLPSVALKGGVVSNFDSLLGTSYLHIGIINSLIKNEYEIGESSEIVGVQLPNIKFRFKFFETFIVGYPRCLMFHNDIMSKKEVFQEAIGRSQHCAALALLDHASDCNHIIWKPNFKNIFEVYNLFGIRSYRIILIMLLMMSPRTFVKFIFNKRVDSYLKDISSKKNLIKNYE